MSGQLSLSFSEDPEDPNDDEDFQVLGWDEVLELGGSRLFDETGQAMWMEQAWRILKKNNLTRYKNAPELLIVQARFCWLARFYMKCFDFLWDIGDLTSLGDYAELLEVSPFWVGFLAGEAIDSSESPSCDNSGDDWLKREGFGVLVRRCNDLRQVITKGFGDEAVLLVSILRCCQFSERSDPESDEYWTDYDILDDHMTDYLRFMSFLEGC